MTPFEFVFALISIISSLALAKIITDVVAIIRHQDRSGFSLTHALWVWIAFAVVIGNWGALWGARLYPDWPSLRVLAWLASVSALYAFCAFVLPEVEPSRPLDLEEFHRREGRRYILAHNAFALIAITLVLMLSGLPGTSRIDLVPPIVALLLGTAALLTRGRAQLLASLMVAVVATNFMLTEISIMSAEAAQ